MDQAQQLRNVIKQRNQNYIEPARVITITSGKGGVGKSNTSVNLAVWLSRLGKRVIIFDADFGLANVMLFDPECTYAIDKNKFWSKAKNTPFHGRKVTGKVMMTICEGKIVYDAAEE